MHVTTTESIVTDSSGLEHVSNNIALRIHPEPAAIVFEFHEPFNLFPSLHSPESNAQSINTSVYRQSSWQAKWGPMLAVFLGPSICIDRAVPHDGECGWRVNNNTVRRHIYKTRRVKIVKKSDTTPLHGRYPDGTVPLSRSDTWGKMGCER